MRHKLRVTGALVGLCMLVAACFKHMIPTTASRHGNELLQKANAAKTHPLTPEASRTLENQVLEEYLQRRERTSRDPRDFQPVSPDNFRDELVES